MADKTPIEWTDATWPIVQGCDYESPGCTNCYAVPLIWRLSHNPNPTISAPLQGLVEKRGDKLVWTGKLALREDRLTWPLKWRAPRKIFVPSHGDIFHEDVPDDFLDKIFAVMALCPQHIFQVLTKRAERMRAYLSPARAHPVGLAALDQTLRSVSEHPRSDVGRGCILQGDIAHLKLWPLPNVWLGVSVEDQRRADERIPLLLETPAAVRFLSCEPLLGPVDLDAADHGESALERECWGDCICPAAPPRGCRLHPEYKWVPGIDWVIAGGESGPNAKPMHPDWARSLRDQCAAAGVPFFFKQWGEYRPVSRGIIGPVIEGSYAAWPDGHIGAGRSTKRGGYGTALERVGKARAGRLLDGIEHNAFPSVAAKDH